MLVSELGNYLSQLKLAVLDPHGAIGLQERDLIVTATLLMLLVVVPVFILTAVIAWRYRASNTKAKYAPDWEHNATEEFIWWAIPFTIIAILASITWTSTHQLDPWKPIASDVPPLKIQAVGLDWKWLFIYPDQHIASLNFLEIPAHTPIEFQITADAPMNSLWIPQLGGQLYGMPGMVTKLHLIADDPGGYSGYNANFSGDGFSGMSFPVQAVPQTDFEAWTRTARASGDSLDDTAYETLARPSSGLPVTLYASVAPDLFDRIVMKYMIPTPMAVTASAATPLPAYSTTATSMPDMPMDMPMNAN